MKHLASVDITATFAFNRGGILKRIDCFIDYYLKTIDNISDYFTTFIKMGHLKKWSISTFNIFTIER